MKTFEFSKATTARIVKAYNNSPYTKQVIDDILALATIKKCYGNKCNIRIFKTYWDKEITYALYEDDNTILTFDNESKAYKFIFAL